MNSPKQVVQHHELSSQSILTHAANQFEAQMVTQ
jgi:hypothetical protein